MLKNLRRKTQERDRVHLDCFKYTRVCEHGYLHRPSAIAYCPTSHLLAIGTHDGRIKVFGRPGVESEAVTSDTTSIQQLIFLANGLIVSVCDNGEVNSLHRWRIGAPMVEEKACTLEGRLKKISTCCLSTSRECLYIGTEGGHIYVLDLLSFELREHIIYQDIVMKSLPSNVTSSGGPVEDIKEHPLDSSQILIGYQKGLIVLWNQDDIKIESYYVAKHYVESVHWGADYKGFISAQENGSLCLWALPEPGTDESGVMLGQSTPFGPFPCKSILKVEWYEPIIVFSGGLPRASYSDKNCISILEDNQVQAVLDFSSKVVDFVVMKEPDEAVPYVLMVLCEEEIVFVDLQTEEKNFAAFSKPYLSCIHSSNISASAHIADCPHELWSILKEAGRRDAGTSGSHKEWPINGGYIADSTSKTASTKDILITGHDDGTIKFWDASQTLFNLLCTINTAKLYREYDGPPPEDPDEDDWPPFKKVCAFDPLSDDPRFVIQKMALCAVTKTLIVGGSGGQLLSYKLGEAHNPDQELKSEYVNIIEDLSGFAWKGHGPLTFDSQAETDSTFYPSRVLQAQPSAPITALAIDTASGLMAFGTCHGYAIYDNVSSRVALIQCTVNPTDLANTGAGIQRKRTITKSLRDSFRRLRSRRKSARPKQKSVRGAGPESPPGRRGIDPFDEASPQSRLISENRVEDDMMSMVRCLCFAETFLGDVTNPILTLWAGTNAGYIHVHSITVPDEADRADKEIKSQVGKDLKLKHHAPVINVMVIDKDGIPVAPRTDREAGRTATPDMTCGHNVLIMSEEQLKIFTLPTLRHRNKEKLTAIDGSRLRKTATLSVVTKEEGVDTTHHCLVCLTNLGDIIVYSLPGLREQFKTNIVKREDIRAILSLLFTNHGEMFYMKSPSAMQRSAILPSALVAAIDFGTGSSSIPLTNGID